MIYVLMGTLNTTHSLSPSRHDGCQNFLAFGTHQVCYGGGVEGLSMANGPRNGT